MIRRLVNPSQSMSFFVFGARGTGKSTWLREHFAADAHLWIDLTDPAVERRYARRPEILLEEWKALNAHRQKTSQEPVWVVVDEVQKIPVILDVVHVGIERLKIKFALTGSSARKLKRGAANLLAGRALTYKIYPLTVTELGDTFQLADYLHWGGLPMLLQLPEHSDRKKYLQSYIDTYLREEIQIEQLVRKIEPFRMFLDIAGQMNGEIINMAKISREAGIDPKSGERYFEILADTLVGFYLPAFDRSVRKAQLQHPKFYFFDVGVARGLRGELSSSMEPHTGSFGRAFEHFIIQQIKALNDYFDQDFRLSYLRTKDDNEVDLVIQKPSGETLFCEIKSTDRPEHLSCGPLIKLAQDAGATPIVICRTERPFAQGTLLFWPWQEALRQLFPRID